MYLKAKIDRTRDRGGAERNPLFVTGPLKGDADNHFASWVGVRSKVIAGLSLNPK